MEEYDVIVVGGGPSGSTATMYLAKAGVKVLLADKAEFPRDKICGDAQGRKAANIIRELGIEKEYLRIPGQKVYGITLSSPNGSQVDLDVESRDKPAPGFVHKRKLFDEFLFSSAKKLAPTKVIEITGLIMGDGAVKGIIGKDKTGKTVELRAKLVIGSDGANSVVARKLGVLENPPEHFIVGTRQYYKGVTGLSDRIEIHMIKELLPGYFWIFPQVNGESNVGLGMIVKDMQSKKINLKEAMLRQIKENKLFKERFRNAQPLEDMKGWSLPIASHHRKCHFNGCILIGDAASLIDPLSGEGVGNAMISGRIAARIAIEAIKKNDFSEKFLSKYDKELWDEIGPEIRANYKVQRLGTKFPFLIDKVVMKAAKDENFRRRMEKMLPYTGGRKEMGSAGFLEELAPEEKKAIEEARKE